MQPQIGFFNGFWRSRAGLCGAAPFNRLNLRMQRFPLISTCCSAKTATATQQYGLVILSVYQTVVERKPNSNSGSKMTARRSLNGGNYG